MRRTLDRLLDLGAVPIINENDSLASNEIRFGDNDRLSALIANIVVADALVLLTDVDALYTAPPSEPGSKRISYVPNVEDALAKVQVGGTGSNVGTGGMVTKMEAARVAAVSGIPGGVDMRVERRSRDDGRSGRHRVRADQRPRFVT